jgi:glycosyltransferase involved in cell wall biosynthesis
MIKKLSILQVVPSMISGGVERGVLEINKALINAGHKSFVASNGGKMAINVDHIGGKHITLPLKSKNIFTIWRNISKLVEIIKKYHIDIVHARSRAPAWSAYFACKKTGCKFVTTIHGNYSIGGKGFFGKLKKWYNSSMVRGDRVIVISEYIKKYAINNYRLFRQKITEKKVDLIHRGVDMELFNPDIIKPHRIIKLQKKLNLPDDKKIIMLPGRLTSWKGQEYLIDALKFVKSKNYFCLIVGDDKGHTGYKKRLEDKIINNNLQGFVGLERHIPDMSAGYMFADIVVSASTRGEAFGRVAPEGQAMKRSVIATAIGGSLETIIDGKTGWLVPVKDPKKFAEVIDKVLNMSDRQRVIIGNRARKHIEENFSKKKMCEKIIKTYKKVIREN